MITSFVSELPIWVALLMGGSWLGLFIACAVVLARKAPPVAATLLVGIICIFPFII